MNRSSSAGWARQARRGAEIAVFTGLRRLGTRPCSPKEPGKSVKAMRQEIQMDDARGWHGDSDRTNKCMLRFGKNQGLTRVEAQIRAVVLKASIRRIGNGKEIRTHTQVVVP